MSTKETIARIREAFDALDALNDIDHRKMRDTLYSKCLAEERGHRRANAFGGTYRCSADITAQMFVVRDLAAFLSGAKPMPAIGAVLWMKGSYIYAAAIVDNNYADVKKALSGHNLHWLANLAYVKLVNGVAQ